MPLELNHPTAAAADRSAFEFGLARILDGLGTVIESR
jgi:hypothetical protein